MGSRRSCISQVRLQIAYQLVPNFPKLICQFRPFYVNISIEYAAMLDGLRLCECPFNLFLCFHANNICNM
jgi:hypothetical protein